VGTMFVFILHLSGWVFADRSSSGNFVMKRPLPMIAGIRWLTMSEGSLAVLVLLLVASRVFFHFVVGYTVDDAFITYRYARNLAEGHGFVYNLSEKVQGASSPLYIVLLALVSLAFGGSAIPLASQIVSLAADTASLVLLWRLLSPLRHLIRFWVGALFALYPKVVLIETFGMEASLVVLLMLLSLYLYSKGAVNYALLAFSLLLLCRIDAIIWVAVCVLWGLRRGIRIPLSSLVAPALLLTSWAAFSFLYFGSLMPHAVAAKSISLRHLFPFFDPLRVLAGYLPFEGFKESAWLLRLVLVMVCLLPVVVELIRLSRDANLLVIFPAFFLSYNIVYSFGRVEMQDWYYLPGYVAYFVTLGCFLERVFQSLKRISSPKTHETLLRFFPAVFLAVLVLIGAHRWIENPGWRYRQNEQLGMWFKEHAPLTARIFLEPIGEVGWKSGVHIDDYIGLVSPRVVQYRERYPDSDEWFIRYVHDVRPDYLVLRNWEIHRNILFQGRGGNLFSSEEEKNWFQSTYVPVEWSPLVVGNDAVYFVIYHRRSSGLKSNGTT
jgi:hypothetical protein